MDIADIEGRIEAIKKMAADWEAAHSWEDQLYRDVLEAIANGASDPRELAKAALASQAIPFARYCA